MIRGDAEPSRLAMLRLPGRAKALVAPQTLPPVQCSTHAVHEVLAPNNGHWLTVAHQAENLINIVTQSDFSDALKEICVRIEA